MEQWQMEMSGWYPEFQALRHRLHREPERSFQEHGTTQLIRELLTGWGAEVEEHPGLETGLTALIRGAHPGPTVALREDIDALPMGGEHRSALLLLPGGALSRLRPRHPYRRPALGRQGPVQAPGPPPRVGQADLPVCRGGGSRRGADAGPGRPGTGPPGSGGGLSL